MVTPAANRATQNLGPAANRGAIDVQGAGTLTVVMATPQYDIRVTRLSISGPAQSLCKVYVGSLLTPGGFKCISYVGQNDDADFPQGMFVSGSDQLFLAWFSFAAPATIFTPVPITNAASGSAVVNGEYRQDQDFNI